MKRFTFALVALALVAIEGCSGSSSRTSSGPTAPMPALVAAADLHACPKSSATVVPGGLPDLTVTCLAPGRSVHLAGLTGKPTVVNLWGSWCPPCQKEEQYLSAANKADGAKVRFLGVDIVDDPNSALDFDAHVTPPVHFPSVFDPDRKVALGLNVASPPYTFFVDRTGKIVGKSGGAYTSTAAVQADITRYLHVPT